MMNRLKTILLAGLLVGGTASFAQLEVIDNNTVKLGNTNVNVYVNDKGKFNQAQNWDFNPYSTVKGVVMEQGMSESSGFYADGDYAVIWSPGDYYGPNGELPSGRLLRIYDEDNMYSGSTNYEIAYISENGTYVKISDSTRKENIQQLLSCNDKIMQIRGVKYNFKADAKAPQNAEEDKEKSKIEKRPEIGFLAQEVEQVFPEVVETDAHGNKFMNYDGMIPILLEALKEQNNVISQLNKDLEAIKKELSQLKKDK